MPEQDSQNVTSQLAAGLLGKSPIAAPQAEAPAAPANPEAPAAEPTGTGVTGTEPAKAGLLDPALQAALDSRLDAVTQESNAQINGVTQQIQGLTNVVQQLIQSHEEQNNRLDPEKLKDMSMGEAMAEMEVSLSGKTESQMKRLMSPFVGDLLNLKVQNDVLMAKAVYPNLDVAKHVNRMRQERISNPDLPLADLIQKVVPATELNTQPKTPAPQNGMHMETGPSNTPSGVTRNAQPQAGQGYTPEEQRTLLGALNEANVNGNPAAAEQYANALLADRLANSGIIPRQGG